VGETSKLGKPLWRVVYWCAAAARSARLADRDGNAPRDENNLGPPQPGLGFEVLWCESRVLGLSWLGISP
jgi:hypothetical protein